MLIERTWKAGEEVAGAVTLVYDHHRKDLMSRITDVQHDYHHLIISTQHIHLDHDHCLEIIAVRGRAGDIAAWRIRCARSKASSTAPSAYQRGPGAGLIFFGVKVTRYENIVARRDGLCVAFWESNAPWYAIWLRHNEYHRPVQSVLGGRVRPGWRVLDIGGGSGVLSSFLREAAGPCFSSPPGP